jgi:son of sevenless-like protein
MAILAGLDTAPIHRLKRTWELLSTKSQAILDALKGTMNPTKNFSKYRETLHAVNPPCVPFLGFYLTDLTFIEDGSSNTLKNSRDLINFAKRMKTADVIREIQQYQNVAYLLCPVPELQQFLKQSFLESADEQGLYEMSLALEPRERYVTRY